MAPLSLPELEIAGEPFLVPQTAPLEPTMPVSDLNDNISPSTPALTQSQGSIDDSVPMPPSPARLIKIPPPAVKKNLSSSSPRMRNLSVTMTETSDSPITPMSATFSPEAKKPVPPLPSAALPTPSASNFGPQLLQAGGMYLFDDLVGVHDPVSPRTPRSPDAAKLSVPQQLEPCPESSLLRPFWLMRCLYQTLAHPHGGYLTSKLFIPREVWRVRNVKLKAVDDKVSQCDMLTAALLKFKTVNTFDADAMLEELEAFEQVLDQVRATLQKKLGGDVGFSGSSNLFRAAEDNEAPKTNNTAAKSIASSWRKLRSKSSAPAIGNQSGTKDAVTSGPTIPTLPMTSSSSVPTSRSYNRKFLPPPTPSQLPMVVASHAYYMSSLARLFDAAQVLDGIARQVEDPGLKCSNKTQVGLELGVKNAAEFFAFFVCRFVLNDLGLLVDKFLKRGGEWACT
jgi:hypothetical protein